MPEPVENLSEQKRLRKIGLRVKGHSYSDRNRMLREMGFESYAAYLRSPLWESIRLKVYEIKGGWCFLCEKPADMLHHNRYHLADLEGRRLRYISPVCRRCHLRIEFDGSAKRGVRGAARRFKTLRAILLSTKRSP